MLLPQGRIQHSSKEGVNQEEMTSTSSHAVFCLLLENTTYLRRPLVISGSGGRVRTPCNLLQIHTCTTREENKYNPLLLFLIHLAEGVGSHPHLPSSSHYPATCVAKFHSDLTNTFAKKKDVTEIMIGLTGSTQSASAQPSICHNSYGKN